LFVAIWAASGGCGHAPADSPGGPAAGQGVVLLVSGDTAGWIVPCGCTSNQSGGLPRRATYIAKLREQGPVIVADAGGAPAGASTYDRLKFEAILQGERTMEIAAHNIGAPEARLGADYLRDVAARLGAPLVSCNLLDAAGRPVAEPARVVAAGGRKIALIGVMDEQYAEELKGLQIRPPREAILETLKQLQSRETIDAVVVLAYLPPDRLRELAGSLPEADLVVGGPTGQSIPPEHFGPTLLASATNKGKFLARFDSSAAKAWQGQIVEMNATIADDPAQLTVVRKFYAELERRDLPPSQTSFAAPPPPNLPAGYAVAGSQSCRRCHAADAHAWDNSKHAAAWGTLAARGAEVDSFCQKCHSTGYGLPGGFASPRRTPDRTGVGCEDCHGPAAGHVADPKTPTPFFARAAGSCTKCHDHENSPAFAYDVYWPRIRHGQKQAGKETR